jgi:hypothetical protein
MPRTISKVTAGVMISLFALASAAGSKTERSDSAGSESGDTMLQLNQFFRDSYSDAKKDALKRSGVPVLVVTGGKLILVNGDSRSEYPYATEQFTVLKTIDHAPLAVFVMLDGHTGRLDERMKVSLKHLCAFLESARAELTRTSLDKEDLSKDYQICDAVKAFIDTALATGQVSEGELLAFTNKLAPVIQATVYDSVAADLASLDEQMVKCRRALSDEQWRKLHVVVTGSHVARQNNMMMQYFSRVLKEPAEGGRLIYFEGGDGVDGSLNLLATHLLDSQIGVAFWGDPWRMHRDLLGDAASLYLDQHHSAVK